MRARQITISLGNRPGELAKICRVLADSGVSIRAFSTSGDYDIVALRLVVDDERRAKEGLSQAGYFCMVADVLVVEMRDRVRGAAEVAQKLAEADINITYAYASSSGPGECMLVFGVPDVERAERAIAR